MIVSEAHALPAHVVRLVRERTPPLIVVVDLDLHVLSWSLDTSWNDTIRAAGDDLREAVRTCCATSAPSMLIMNETMVRIVPLDGLGARCAAIFIENVGYRGSLEPIIRRYRLTKREAQILRLVVDGMSNSEIGGALCIALSTVADHMKSLMRKTQTTKRVHLVSKWAYGE